MELAARKAAYEEGGKIGLEKVEKLEHWPIIASQEGSVEKGLFGKKNTSIWSAKNQWSEEW